MMMLLMMLILFEKLHHVQYNVIVILSLKTNKFAGRVYQYCHNTQTWHQVPAHQRITEVQPLINPHCLLKIKAGQDGGQLDQTRCQQPRPGHTPLSSWDPTCCTDLNRCSLIILCSTLPSDFTQWHICHNSYKFYYFYIYIYIILHIWAV